MMYTPKPLSWIIRTTKELTILETDNCFIDYHIKCVDRVWYCFYSNKGRYKEFKTLDDAKDWVENIHYPAQIRKYFDEVPITPEY